jgi:hypothetical protein
VKAGPPGSAATGLTGVGLRPAVLSAPATLTFSGTTARGSTSSAQIITVTNNGDVASATLSPSTISGAGFAITSDGCNGASVQAMKSCQVSVQFAPTATGPGTATLNINNGSTVVASTTLNGTATPGWGPEATDLTLGVMNDVWGLDAADVWAVGLGGTIVRRDTSGKWMPETAQFMHPPDIFAVWGLTTSQLYAASSSGVLFSAGDKNWSNPPLAPTQNCTGIWGFHDANNVYASTGGTVYYPNGGHSWLAGGAAAFGEDRVWGTNFTDLYTYGAGDGYPRIFHMTASPWQKAYEGLTTPAGNTITALWGFGAPATVVYATQAMGPPLYLNNGGGFTKFTTPPPPINCTAVWGPDTSTVFFACQGGISSYDGNNNWSTPTAIANFNPRWLWGTSKSDFYAVGTDNSGKGAIYHYY